MQYFNPSHNIHMPYCSTAYVLNQAKILYSFRQFTGMLLAAVLCGCLKSCDYFFTRYDEGRVYREGPVTQRTISCCLKQLAATKHFLLACSNTVCRSRPNLILQVPYTLKFPQPDLCVVIFSVLACCNIIVSNLASWCLASLQS